MAQTKEYIEFLLQVGEFAVEDRLPKLRETVRELLQLIPSGLCVCVCVFCIHMRIHVRTYVRMYVYKHL